MHAFFTILAPLEKNPLFFLLQYENKQILVSYDAAVVLA